MGRTVDFRIRKPESIPVDELTAGRLADLLVKDGVAEDIDWGPAKKEEEPVKVQVETSVVELPVKEISKPVVVVEEPEKSPVKPKKPVA